ncbi:AAA family ATPase [Entomospira culicis]|uniref:AAA family ATPase n=1 Tax=Entomospira culicis TaxID=2719989 RepID=A0A968GJI9_9SPIO|nr:AAA family ATPase [Entomospira culicis]NIZ19996.1 AAA family ATPase [Entomospira culicis]NIZ70202.1 AAA family ATPase [Entomospira culicis]WDI38097.1 AAA family ATPase [Entomospira culicis]WDI39719.1 AAA family ATPase [Entomospira culicis]
MFSYKKFVIHNYKAISTPVTINIHRGIYPILGVNESGKTTLLHAMMAFTDYNDLWNGDSSTGKQGYRHIDKVANIYTDTSKAKIEAEITCSVEEFQTIIESSEIEKEAVLISKLMDLSKDATPLTINITREINGEKRYLLNILVMNEVASNYISEEEQHRIASLMVNQKLPLIVYFDDFKDRFTGIIDILIDEKGAIKSPGDTNVKTLEQFFEVSFKNKEGEAKKKLSNLATDTNNKVKEIESKLQQTINTLINDQWELMAKIEERDPPKIVLRIERTEKTAVNKKEFNCRFSFTVEDSLIIGEEKEIRVFDLEERSKGFLWFFTFVWKTSFHPNKNSEKSVIYLLDEPGSYLHSSAQQGLCNVLEELAKDATVIYTTHSHYMLDEDFLNNTYIAHKDEKENKTINLCHYTQYTKIDKTPQPNALDPIILALKVEPSLIEKMLRKKALIIVEGMGDFYAWQSFLETEHKSNLGIIPSTGASQVLTLLSLALIHCHNVLCLLDDDDEVTQLKTKHPDFSDYIRVITGNKDITFLLDENELKTFAKTQNSKFNKDNLCLNDKKQLLKLIYAHSRKHKIEFPETKKTFEKFFNSEIKPLLDNNT